MIGNLYGLGQKIVQIIFCPSVDIVGLNFPSHVRQEHTLTTVHCCL